MNIHQLRNATVILETADQVILVDPMLGPARSFFPFTLFRHAPKANPLVQLPLCAGDLLERVTHCLITHSQALGFRPLQHLDHLDQAGEDYLRRRAIPVGCPERDARYLRRYGINVKWELPYRGPMEFLGGSLEAIPARHGYGWIHHLMANGAGFLLRLPGEPSVYLSGDTILTNEVRRVLVEERPEVAVVAAGAAQLDIGQPLLMTLPDLLEFVELAPGWVVANHLESLNHCPVTRSELRAALARRGLSEKVVIPHDGETLTIPLA